MLVNTQQPTARFHLLSLSLATSVLLTGCGGDWQNWFETEKSQPNIWDSVKMPTNSLNMLPKPAPTKKEFV